MCDKKIKAKLTNSKESSTLDINLISGVYPMANYINGKINILTRDVPEADHKKLLKLAERWMYKTGHKVSINDIMRQAIKLIIKNGGIDD